MSKFLSSPLLPTTTLSRLTYLSLSQIYSFPRLHLQCDLGNVRFGDDRLTAPEETLNHALYKLPKYRSSSAADRLLVLSAADLRE
jgi:hypothetical protein